MGMTKRFGLLSALPQALGVCYLAAFASVYAQGGVLIQGAAPTQPTSAPTQPTSASQGSNAPPANPQQVAPLVAFKAGLTNGASISALSTWQGSNPCSGWTGVTCDQGGNVISIDLTGAGLSGQLEPTLSTLSSLATLNLGKNSLTGGIPIAWSAGGGSLSSLKQLDLSTNQLTGPLLPGLSQLNALQTLLLGSNGFTGNLPPEWGTGFGSLQQLLLSSNKLTGTLPPTWGSGLPSLQTLDLSGNNLQGSVPSTWGGGSSLPNLSSGGLIVKPGNAQLCGVVPSGLVKKISPSSAISGTSLVCNGSAAPPAPAPGPSAGAVPTAAQSGSGTGSTGGAVVGAGSSSGSTNAPTNSSSGNNVIGARFALQGLTSFSNAQNQTTASAIKTALGAGYSQIMLQYIGSIARNSSQGRRLLQTADGFNVYYNILKVPDSGALQARLQDSSFQNDLQGLLNSNGVPVNNVAIDQITPGGITVPGQQGITAAIKPINSGLSTGAKIGIAIGAAALFLLLLLCCCCCCLAAKKKKAKQEPYEPKQGSFFERRSQPYGSSDDFNRDQMPLNGEIKHQRVGPPIVLNTNETRFQGQQIDLNQSQQNPMYNVAPTDGTTAFIDAPAPAQESKMASWWGGRKPTSSGKAALEATPAASPFSPQIESHNTPLDYPNSGGDGGAAGHGAADGGGGRGIAEWLRPDSQDQPQSQVQTGAQGQKRQLSNIVTDIRDI